MPLSCPLLSVGKKIEALNNSYMSLIVLITSLWVVSISFLNAAKNVFDPVLNVICIKPVLPQEANSMSLKNMIKTMSKLSQLR